MRIIFVEDSGAVRTLEGVAPDQSLMEAARSSGIEGILADCGGGCACATCHVYVDPGWQAIVGPPDDVEAEMLDMVSDVQRANSRLSCQILLRPELDGLTVRVAPNAW